MAQSNTNTSIKTVISHSSLIPLLFDFPTTYKYRLFVDPVELPENTSRILWFIVANANASNGDSLLSPVHKEMIESCCLLESLELVVIGDQMLDTDEEWLNDTIPEKWKIEQIPFQNTEKMTMTVSWVNDQYVVCPFLYPVNTQPLVISSLCLGMSIDEIVKADCNYKSINMCHCSNYTLHQIRALRRALDAASISVESVNGLFFDRVSDNVFHKGAAFIEQFQKMIYFAQELGAKAIIYGGANSKYIHVSKSEEYVAYMNAHGIFTSAMKQMAASAEKCGITIYIKPNHENCNYLFANDQVSAMVTEIAHDSVKAGPIRDGIVTCYDTFDLLEYNGECFADAESRLVFLNLLMNVYK